jgi:protein-tyrosine phosphatase
MEGLILLIIDIHNHTLYGVDDGPDSIKESIKMLQDAKSQGVEAIILTPHYRHGMFAYPTKLVEDNFEYLRQKAKPIGINLYLGCEYHMDDMAEEMFESRRCHTLADGEYVLTEYKYEVSYNYIERQTYHMLSCGYIPVIAHAERYKCLVSDAKLCDKLSRMGALIQINADSVLGLTGFGDKRFCKKLLKNEWVDIIASDTHGHDERNSHMGQCYEYISNKYDSDYANLLFYKNPNKLLALPN